MADRVLDQLMQISEAEFADEMKCESADIKITLQDVLEVTEPHETDDVTQAWKEFASTHDTAHEWIPYAVSHCTFPIHLGMNESDLTNFIFSILSPLIQSVNSQK
jgi:hypothetical protein